MHIVTCHDLLIRPAIEDAMSYGEYVNAFFKRDKDELDVQWEFLSNRGRINKYPETITSDLLIEFWEIA